MSSKNTKQFKLRYILIPLFSLIAAALIFLFFLHIKRTITVQNFIEKLEATVQDGDIICRLGDRIWSLYFKGLSKQDKRFSHLGIIHISEGEIFVINAEGLAWEGRDKVSIDSLAHFIKPAGMIGIYRLPDVNGEIISKEALKFIDRPFDWYFDLENDEKIYCTELLYAALKYTYPEIQLKTIKKYGRDIIPLEAISDSPQFLEILFIQ